MVGTWWLSDMITMLIQVDIINTSEYGSLIYYSGSLTFIVLVLNSFPVHSFIEEMVLKYSRIPMKNSLKNIVRQLTLEWKAQQVAYIFHKVNCFGSENIGMFTATTTVGFAPGVAPGEYH